LAGVYDDIDVRFAYNGDFLLGDDMDLKDTSDDTIDSMIEQLHDVAASAFQDWELYPNRGATLDDFVGEPNTRETGDRIHDRLKLSIIAAGILAEEDMEIKVIPVHINKVLVMIKVSAIATPTNSLGSGNNIVVKFVFDYLERGVFFWNQTPDLI